MKLIKATIKNYRLLHNIAVMFDNDTTSIVGKNNSGKTSLSAICKVFLDSSEKNFTFNDFSLASHESFINIYNSYLSITEENKEAVLAEIQAQIPKIQLFLTVKYSDSDNWTNIKPFITKLDDSDEFTILCQYAPVSTEHFIQVLKEAMEGLTYTDDELLNKIKSHYQNNYKIIFRPFSKTESVDNVSRHDINELIQIKFIDAQRVLDDSNADTHSKLSKLFHDQFKAQAEEDDSISEELLQALESASGNIDLKLEDFFSPFVGFFRNFGFPGMGQEQVELKSQLGPDVLFKNNVKLFYNHDGHSLPEKYNGLGYSNLIYIIAQIVGFYNDIKDKKNNLNFIFIEEPEAHMHPQMQTVFVNNIQKFLQEVSLDAQVVITTHSPHILSASNLESIRYFTPAHDSNVTIIKDLLTFNESLNEPETKEFLQQYLTLGKCDLFFADKAVLIEGTVERLLFPVFIKKIENSSDISKLSEQYVSLIEIGGAYMNKFKELLEFLELKTLIITDIDAVDSDSKKHKVEAGVSLETSNVTLKNWLPGIGEIDNLLNPAAIKENSAGTIRVAYQKNVSTDSEPVKCGRSFEEAFVIDNNTYIFNNKDKLLSIKFQVGESQDGEEIKSSSYDIQEFIDRNRKKTDFAFDLLSINKDDWSVPEYIAEGLKWLAK